MKKFISGLISLVLIVALGVGAYFLFFKKDESEETSIMTMSVNPQVQFILDQNNKVMDVTAVNEDGVKLLTQVNFEGMSAEDAAKLFVEMSSTFKTGVFEFNVDAATGKEVNIYISCESDLESSDLIKNLRTNVQNSVNQYFQDNGILAGARVQLSAAADQIKMFGEQIETFTSSSFEDAMTYAREISKEFENVSYSARAEVKTIVNTLKDTFQKTNETLLSSISKFSESITTLQSQIADEQKKIEGYQKQLDEIKLDSFKEPIQELLDAAEKQLANFQKQLDEAQKKLNEAQAEYKTALENLQKEIDAKVKEIQDKCKTALEELKTTIQTQVEAGKEQLANYKVEIEKLSEEQKQALKTKIEEYQNSIATPIA